MECNSKATWAHHSSHTEWQNDAEESSSTFLNANVNKKQRTQASKAKQSTLLLLAAVFHFFHFQLKFDKHSRRQ